MGEQKPLRQFRTFQPATINPNQIKVPATFNGFCLIREYEVTVMEVEAPREVLIGRLVALWKEHRVSNSSNIRAMEREARNLGIRLDRSRRGFVDLLEKSGE